MKIQRLNSTRRALWNTRPMNRRSFLRGCLGGAVASLALPPLEAMLDENGAWADGEGDQPFFGLFYWANGAPWHSVHGAEQAGAGHPDLWTPSTIGAGYTPSSLLEPLSGHAINVISGLEPHTEIPPTPGGQGDGHMRGFMVSLTGDRPQPETFNHSSHTLTALRPTLDQYIARHPQFYQTPASYRSLELGISGARFHTYGHWNAISYNGPDSINLPTMEPIQLYNRLFGTPPDTREADRKSALLDVILEDAQRLRTRLGARDRQRLEAHLEQLYEIKQRVDDSTQVCAIPEAPNNSGDLIQKTRTMAELLAIALNCGLTRVFSFMLTSPASTHIFSNLGVPDGMHKTCHDGHWERVRDITRYQMQAFSAFLDALSIEHPNGGALLDRGLVYATSEYGEGWKHSVKELPVLMAGGSCGRLNQNIHVRRPGGNLSVAQLTALRALGLDDPSFGWNGGTVSVPFNELLS
jgi:hypothetical protein